MPRNPADTAPRFLAPEIDPVTRQLELPRDEAHHLTKVLRLGAGARVRVFDGRGNEFDAEVAEAHGSRVRLTLGARVPAAESSLVPVTLVLSVLKGDAMDHAVRDATMMGVRCVQPIVSAHTAVKPAMAQRAESAARWQRVAIASAKQSRRATIPDVRNTIGFDEALAALQGQALICVEPSADDDVLPARVLFDRPRPPAATLLTGPEGGWSSSEVAAAISAGAAPISLGPLTLRADAMPTAALAVLMAAWG